MVEAGIWIAVAALLGLGVIAVGVWTLGVVVLRVSRVELVIVDRAVVVWIFGTIIRTWFLESAGEIMFARNLELQPSFGVHRKL